jgi:hypothetical protein
MFFEIRAIFNLQRQAEAARKNSTTTSCQW